MSNVKAVHKSNRINFKITDDMKEQVQAAAEALEISMSAWITLALKKQLAKEQGNR